MVYGYARCSTDEGRQDIGRQLRELMAQGVLRENIYLEYESGMKDNRMELRRVMERMEQGDALIATEVSRITRSTKQLCELLEWAKTRKLCMIFGAFKVDCTKELDPMTEGMLKMMGVFAELERNIISQRVKSGMSNAKAKGKKIGRRPTTAENLPSIFYRHYPLLESGMISKKELARLCNISYPTVFKYLNLVQGKINKNLTKF